MRLKRSLAAVLAIIMAVSASGCVQITDGSSSSSPSSQQGDSERFEQMLDEEFSDIVSDSLLDSTFMLENPESFGIKDIKKQLGSIDFDQLDNAAQYWQEDVDELKGFDYDKLTEEQQLTYDLLEYSSELIKPVLSMGYYGEINSPLLGVQSNLPTTLNEFRFDDAQDVRDYIEMLGTTESYFDDMVKYQQRRSADGLFMSDRMATSVIEFCRSFADEGESCLLIEGFPNRLDKLTNLAQTERDELIESNRKAVLEHVLPTYKNFADELEKLKGTGREDTGMAAMPNGKTYYEYLVAEGSGSDWDVKTMSTVLDDTLRECYQRMFNLIINDPELYDRMIDYDGGEQEPKQVIESLIKQCEGRFPKLAELTYDVKYVHPSQEDNSSPAFYYIPAIDSSGNNTIYINRKYIDDYPTVYTLLGHEGYPGHMYQNNYVVQKQFHPIRRLLESGGYAEGWASYVEGLCYDMAGINDQNLVKLMQISGDMDLLLCARADIGVNYEGWGIEELTEKLAEYNIEDPQMTKNVYESVIDEPANYVKYAVGRLEFVELRDRAEKALGDRFDELEFHRALLDDGAVPFSFVNSAVDRYISDQRTASKGKAA